MCSNLVKGVYDVSAVPGLITYIIIEELTRLAEVLSHAHTTIDTILLNLEVAYINTR
jgi:hypothetical protein